MKFKEFINEGTLSAKNLFDNPERIDTMISFVKKGIPMTKGNTQLIIADTYENIKIIKSIKNHKRGISYMVYDTEGNKHNITSLDKTSDFGSNKSLNSAGKALADAGERATLLYLTDEFDTPEGSGEQLFVDNPSAFNNWMETFINTKTAITSIINNLKQYEFIHDGTSGEFTNEISIFCKSVKLNPNTWNPADIWIIKSSKINYIVEMLKEVNSIDIKRGIKIDLMNGLIYKLYNEKLLYPISLKQINPKMGARIDYTNIPGKSVSIPIISGKLKFTNCNLTLDSKEIGTYNVENIENGKTIVFQNKGYPESSNTTQVEITNDGSNSGGRLGKVPAQKIADIYSEYGMTKINPSKEFGKDFSKLTSIKVSEYYKWYLGSIKNAKKVQRKFKSSDELYKYIQALIKKNNSKELNILGHKLQGLQLQYLLSSRTQKELTNVLTKMIYGAMKIDPKSGFFIKIY